jgi:hypothetical protein
MTRIDCIPSLTRYHNFIHDARDNWAEAERRVAPREESTFPSSSNQTPTPDAGNVNCQGHSVQPSADLLFRHSFPGEL